jgi:hypothetical protein
MEQADARLRRRSSHRRCAPAVRCRRGAYSYNTRKIMISYGAICKYLDHNQTVSIEITGAKLKRLYDSSGGAAALSRRLRSRRRLR